MDMFERCTLVRDCALPANLKIVLHELNWHQGANTDSFPSIDRLAAKTGLPRRTVQLVLRQLRDRGLLTVTKARRSSTYMVHWDHLETRSSCASEEPRGAVTARMKRSNCAREAQPLRPNITVNDTSNTRGAKELVIAWQTAFFGQSAPGIPTTSEILVAAELIDSFGMPACRAVLPGVSAQMRREFPRAQTFAAAIRYFRSALEAHKTASATAAARVATEDLRRREADQAAAAAARDRANAAAYEAAFRGLPAADQMHWLCLAGYRQGGIVPIDLCVPLAINQWRESCNRAESTPQNSTVAS